ncbi:MAG: hypothetical protein KGI60_00610 [Patescibacteria group bacterium]|nr:hypothetical protein [Patescibacteria group bacterium]
MAPAAHAAFGFSFFNADPSVENPGLLPTNPFYFLKNITRTVQRAMTTDPVNQANLELDILNQKAGELNKLQQVLDGSDENVKSATDLYGESIDRLSQDVAAINDTTATPAVSDLMTRIVKAELEHTVLFDESEASADAGLRDRLESLSDRLAGMTADAITKLDTPEALHARLDTLLGDQTNLEDDMMAARVLDRLQDKLGDAPSGTTVLLAHDRLMMRVIAKMEQDPSSVPNLFDQVPGDQVRTLVLLDEIREQLDNSDLKNTLAIVRQHLLDSMADAKSASKPEVQRMMDESDQLIQRAAAAGSGVKSATASSLVSHAKFNATQVSVSFDAGQYTDAAGQASLVLASLQDALVYYARADYDTLHGEIGGLKSSYDALAQRAADNNLNQDTASTTADQLDQAAQSIAKLSDLASGKINTDKVTPAFRNADLLLEQADVTIAGLIQQATDAAAAKLASEPLINRVLPFNQ